MPEDATPAVTPWRVTGRVDAQRLVRAFGAQPLDGDMCERLREAAGGDLHPFFTRGIVTSHRDLDKVLDALARGNRFFVYTGRGPSGPVHLGHVAPWLLARWLQAHFGADVYFQLTDEEKFLVRDDVTLEDATRWAWENALDFLALGFEPGRTWLIIDTLHANELYPIAVQVAKRVTWSAARAAFGFTPDTNIGQVFFTAMQAAPAALPSARAGRAIPCLVPMGIDQDPHFRIARDALPKAGFPKPAALHVALLPGLQGPGTKMSASDPATAIYLRDSPQAVRKKIMKHAFSGGQPTSDAQRRFGADPDVDVSYQWMRVFEPSDARLADVRGAYQRGDLLTGELKHMLVARINTFLSDHRTQRELLRDRLGEFLLPRDPVV